MMLVSVVLCRSRYRGQGTDRSKVAQYKRTPADTGSPEVQIAQLSARVIQLTGHLQIHKKDYASRRGLLAALSTRKSLMQYLLRQDRYVEWVFAPRHASIASVHSTTPKGFAQHLLANNSVSQLYVADGLFQVSLREGD